MMDSGPSLTATQAQLTNHPARLPT